MKNLRLLCILLAGMLPYGCAETPEPPAPGEKSADCDLLSFTIDGSRNDFDGSIEFAIDEQTLTVKGVYVSESGGKRPPLMVPTFEINGERTQVEDYLVQSGVARISFSDDFSLTVIAENGDEKTYTVSLDWQTTPDDPDDPDDPDNPDDPDDKDKSPECDMLSFRIDGPLSGLANSIEFSFDANLRASGKYLKWINDAEPDMMIPIFTTTGEKVLVDGEPVVAGKTKVSFADDVDFVVVAENGETKTYTVSLICPQINTELPVLRLSPDGNATSKTTYVKRTLEMYSPSTVRGWWSAADGQIEIRGRGNSTWGLPKKPYRIKFPEKISPVGLNHAKEKSWVILAHDMDKSLLRNHLAFELSRVMFNEAEGYHDPKAIMFTPCSQHVNVYWGDNYYGLYQMTDQMNRADGRIAVDELTKADGSDPSKITGGHILETDIHNSEPSPFGFNSSKGVRINHKYPEDDDYAQAQFTYIENFIKEMEGVLYGSNFKDKTNGWRKYLDEKTLADYIIVKEFAGDMDGYTSTYMYKRRDVNKLFFGPVWDCDKGWDNDKRVPHSSYPPTTSLMIYAGFYMPGANPDWFHRVWQDEDFRKFVRARWLSKRAELIAAVIRELDEKPAQMAKSIEANFTKWTFYYQASTEAKMPAATYKLEIERMRSLTYTRAALLDNLFQ